jgi:GTP pyrophosphokinase
LSYAGLVDAVRYAALAHDVQTRKGSDVPYLSHLLAVSALVIEASGTEAQVLAAVLHDTAEDCGGRLRLDDVRRHFGDEVADIVLACSDSLTSDPSAKEKWNKRKKRYLKHLRRLTPTSFSSRSRTSSTTRR